MPNFFNPCRKDLKDAAVLSDDPAFAKFLNLRADALLSRRLLRQRHRLASVSKIRNSTRSVRLIETYLDDLARRENAPTAPSVMIRQ